MNTEVLVVGAGTVGLTTALFLHRYGIAVTVVEREDGQSIHPRATGVTSRTVELLRELDLLDAVNEVAVDQSAGLGKVTVERMTDLRTAPPAPRRPGISPSGTPDGLTAGTLRGTCPQNRLDAVLAAAAVRRGVPIRYGTAVVAVDQDDDGVRAELADGSLVRARYLVAADGAHSTIRSGLGIGCSGPGVLGEQVMNVLFRADLSELTGGRRFVVCEVTGPPAGLVVTVDGDREWTMHLEGVDTADWAGKVREVLGAPQLPVEVLSVLPWRVRGQLADTYRKGRVFLAGDAAHAVPPLGAFGMNTGVADGHNLAWKLAWVLRDRAGAGLLDTYQAERRPVGAMVLEQAVLRLRDPSLHWDRTPARAAERARLGVRNAPVVALGYRYDSTAVRGALPAPSPEDLALDLDGAPGSRAPHRWITPGRSTLDLPAGGFAVLAGPAGAAWCAAADRIDADVTGHLLDQSWPAGPAAGSRPATAGSESWPAVAGIEADGALLVRPDGFVAARFPSLTADPAGTLAETLAAVLSRQPVRAV